jgi:hypothetical protein
MKWFREGLERYVTLLERHAGRVRRYLGEPREAAPGRAARARPSEQAQAAP